MKYDHRLIFQGMKETFVLQKFLYNEDGEIVDLEFVDVNPASEKVFGRTKKDIIGRTRLELLGPFEPGVLDLIYKARTNGGQLTFEVYVEKIKIWYDVTLFCPDKEHLVSISQDITQRKESEKSLEIAKITSAWNLIEGEEKERRRIATDLHDGIQPLLSSILIKLQFMEKRLADLSAENKQELEKIKQLTQLATSEIRSIAHNLYSPTLADFGLEPSIKNLCSVLDQSEAAEISFYSSGLRTELGQILETSLYRITNELLLNSIRHASPKSVSVQLIEYDEKIIVMVEDDGVGMDTNSLVKGLGMISIDSRTEALGGSFTIDSEKGKGTTVVVEVPKSIDIH